jgi:hypothetical protein
LTRDRPSLCWLLANASDALRRERSELTSALQPSSEDLARADGAALKLKLCRAPNWFSLSVP